MSDQPTSTDINSLLDDLDAGIFREKLARALSDAALAASNTARPPK